MTPYLDDGSITLGDLNISVAGEELVLRQTSKVTHRADELELDDEQQAALLQFLTAKLKPAKAAELGGGDRVKADVDESQRQIILLALAELELRRPGWEHTIGEIADAFGGRAVLEAFKYTSRNGVKPREETDS